MSHDRSPRGGFGTRAIRLASTPPTVRQEASSVPIYQAVTFAAASAEELGDILADRAPGYAYSRIDNPTATAMADALAELEGAQAAFAFGSGMAAVHAALVSLLRAGDRLVCTRAVYGSTRALMTGILARFGVEVEFVDPTDPEAVEAALVPGTRLLYLETISNPTIVVADLADLVERAHRRGVLVVVDNTFASPYLCRPVELGADLVVESCTKWIGGHSDALAGGVAGRRDLVAAVRRVEIDTGGIVAPLAAFLVLRGVQTLHVRMDRSAQTALVLARRLEAHPAVHRVLYPGLPSHPQHAVARRQLRSGGGMLAVDLGTRPAAEAFIDTLTIPPATASLGSIHTFAVYPPTHTHRQLDEAGLAEAGISLGLVRISVGLEDADDLLADLDQALAAATRALASAGPTPKVSAAANARV